MLPTSVRRTVRWSTFPLLAMLLSACNSGDRADASSAESDAATASQISSGRFAGNVTETMDAGGYTYVNLERNGESVWAAGPQTEVAVGDELLVELAMPMPDFESPTIDRKFDMLYFVTVFENPNAPGSGAAKDPHAGIPGFAESRTAVAPGVTEVEKPEDGYRIAEIWARREQLVGKNVAVRGKVVKYNPRILGVNWIHIQDGSGDAVTGTHDLTVTTDHEAAVGDIVTVRGRLAADQDFGAGYKYDLLVEKAKVVAD